VWFQNLPVGGYRGNGVGQLVKQKKLDSHPFHGLTVKRMRSPGIGYVWVPLGTLYENMDID